MKMVFQVLEFVKFIIKTAFLPGVAAFRSRIKKGGGGGEWIEGSVAEWLKPYHTRNAETRPWSASK